MPTEASDGSNQARRRRVCVGRRLDDVHTADWIAAHDVDPVAGPVRAVCLQTAQDNARGRLFTLGAGIFAAGALLYTSRNFTLSRRTFELIIEQGQVTDRFAKAIVQLVR